MSLGGRALALVMNCWMELVMVEVKTRDEMKY
jgi:hypothetical protein